MQPISDRPAATPLKQPQPFNAKKIYYNLAPEQLEQQTLQLGQGKLSQEGALCVQTGKFTGRSPKDKFIVKDAITTDSVDW